MLIYLTTDNLINISEHIQSNNDFLNFISTCKTLYYNDELYYNRLHNYSKFDNIKTYKHHKEFLMKYLSSQGNNSKAINIILRYENNINYILKIGANYNIRWSCR